MGYVADPLPGHDDYQGYLAIPYLRYSQAAKGSVVSVRFRCLQDHDCKALRHGKYITVAGDRPRLFNTIGLLEDSPDICICEGELDAITAQLVLGVPAVGVPGAESWKDHFREPFLGYRRVYILADGDEAGARFANTVAKTLPNAKVIPMPAKRDVNSLYLHEGAQALKDKVR